MTNQYENEYTVVKSKEKKEGVKMQALSTAVPGKWYTIKWMFGLPEVMKAMHNMDIHEGSTIRVLQKFHDSLIISSADRKIVLGNEVADRIQV